MKSWAACIADAILYRTSINFQAAPLHPLRQQLVQIFCLKIWDRQLYPHVGRVACKRSCHSRKVSAISSLQNP